MSVALNDEDDVPLIRINEIPIILIVIMRSFALRCVDRHLTVSLTTMNLIASTCLSVGVHLSTTVSPSNWLVMCFLYIFLCFSMSQSLLSSSSSSSLSLYAVLFAGCSFLYSANCDFAIDLDLGPSLLDNVAVFVAPILVVHLILIASWENSSVMTGRLTDEWCVMWHPTRWECFLE